MREKVFNRMMQVNLWAGSVYCLFMSLSLFKAPDSLVVTQRHQLVFEYILSRNGFALIYLVIALLMIYSIYHVKFRFLALISVAIADVFWAGVAIFPALFGYVPQGNLLGALTSFGFGFLLFCTAILCYMEYNAAQK